MITKKALNVAETIRLSDVEKDEERSFVWRFMVCPRCARPVRRAFFRARLTCKSCKLWWRDL